MLERHLGVQEADCTPSGSSDEEDDQEDDQEADWGTSSYGGSGRVKVPLRSGQGLAEDGDDDEGGDLFLVTPTRERDSGELTEGEGS